MFLFIKNNETIEKAKRHFNTSNVFIYLLPPFFVPICMFNFNTSNVFIYRKFLLFHRIPMRYFNTSNVFIYRFLKGRPAWKFYFNTSNVFIYPMSLPTYIPVPQFQYI